MSKKRGKEISFSEKLSSLIQTKPSVIESEDEDITTVDKIAPKENDSEYSADELDVPKFRKINNDFLEEDDKKYSGRGISRKDLNDSANSDLSDIENDISDGDGEDSSLSDEEQQAGQSDDEDDEDDKDHEDHEESSDSQGFERDSVGNKKKRATKEQQEPNLSKEILLKATSDIEKGRAIKNQLHIWDFLLECRMKFQKCLVASNQMPNYKNFVKFKSKGGVEFQSSVSQCRKSLKRLLNSLLTFQDSLLKSNEEFMNSCKNQNVDLKSDSESDDVAEEENDRLQMGGLSTKKHKLHKFSTKISKTYDTFKSYRNSTIQKWNDKTRMGYISNKNFSAFEQSTLKQIEHVLLDKDRLLKRTQTKRTNYHILGEDEDPPLKKTKLEDNLLGNSFENKNKILQKEIFDDDDFYHQLLSDLVKRKANDVTDPVQLGKQWMQLQKVRNKMKKNVDVKASKGRKVRFVVHPKLVNFMMPIDNSFINEESKVELFNSLFGKSKN